MHIHSNHGYVTHVYMILHAYIILKWHEMAINCSLTNGLQSQGSSPLWNQGSLPFAVLAMCVRGKVTTAGDLRDIHAP